MPTTTNPTPDAALERRIAEGVMGWWEQATIWWSGTAKHSKFKHYVHQWSPWNNAADALEVLERLANPKDAPFGITFWSKEKLWIAWIGATSLNQRYIDAMATGSHFGPAVCRLAEKLMEAQAGEP